MAEYNLSAVAVEDLKAIYKYSHKMFGETQAEHYTRGFHHQFELLARFPGMGLHVELPGHELYRFAYGVHVIVYSKAENGVSIEFLFDGRMDWIRRLKGK